MPLIVLLAPLIYYLPWNLQAFGTATMRFTHRTTAAERGGIVILKRQCFIIISTPPNVNAEFVRRASMPSQRECEMRERSWIVLPTCSIPCAAALDFALPSRSRECRWLTKLSASSPMSEDRGCPLTFVFPLFVVLAIGDLPFKKLDGSASDCGPRTERIPFPAGERARARFVSACRASGGRPRARPWVRSSLSTLCLSHSRASSEL